MRHIKLFESFDIDGIVINIKDIVVDIEDLNYDIDVINFRSYKEIRIYITKKNDLVIKSEILDTIETIFDYMKNKIKSNCIFYLGKNDYMKIYAFTLKEIPDESIEIMLNFFY